MSDSTVTTKNQSLEKRKENKIHIRELIEREKKRLTADRLQPRICQGSAVMHCQKRKKNHRISIGKWLRETLTMERFLRQ